MQFETVDGKKQEVIHRIDRLKDLVEQDAPGILLEAALEEVGRSLDGLMREGRAEGETSPRAEFGEAPPAL